MTLTLKEIQEVTDSQYWEYRELPSTLITQSELGQCNDGITLIKNGKEWAYEFIEKYQPRTWKCLELGSEFTMFVRYGDFGPIVNIIQSINGKLISVHRQKYGFNSSDETFPARSYAGKKARSLPEQIRLAYYHRIDGLGVPDASGLGPFTRILPYPIGRPWQSIDNYLNDLRLKKKLLPIVEEMIPSIKPTSKLDAYTNFMMFLNSRGSFVGEKKTDGDHLFVKNHIQDGIVYYIRDADVANMMILANPAEAIDRYCEHVLLNKDERFDFRPWAVPFESPSI